MYSKIFLSGFIWHLCYYGRECCVTELYYSKGKRYKCGLIPVLSGVSKDGFGVQIPSKIPKLLRNTDLDTLLTVLCAPIYRMVHTKYIYTSLGCTILNWFYTQKIGCCRCRCIYEITIMANREIRE